MPVDGLDNKSNTDESSACGISFSTSSMRWMLSLRLRFVATDSEFGTESKDDDGVSVVADNFDKFIFVDVGDDRVLDNGDVDEESFNFASFIVWFWRSCGDVAGEFDVVMPFLYSKSVASKPKFARCSTLSLASLSTASFVLWCCCEFTFRSPMDVSVSTATAASALAAVVTAASAATVKTTAMNAMHNTNQYNVKCFIEINIVKPLECDNIFFTSASTNGKNRMANQGNNVFCFVVCKRFFFISSLARFIFRFLHKKPRLTMRKLFARDVFFAIFNFLLCVCSFRSLFIYFFASANAPTLCAK